MSEESKTEARAEETPQAAPSENDRNEPRCGLPEGLSDEEAAALAAEGKVNISTESAGKSVGRIVADNLLTFFNLVWAIVTAVLLVTGSFSNLTFLAVVIPNVLIGIFTQLKAKKTVEKLSVTTEPKAAVVRSGKVRKIPAGEIVLGDVIFVESGHQIPADALVLSGVAEANESLLTGESNAIRKEAGAKLLAGSYLVSGGVYAKVTAVGKDNYVHTIESAAKSFKAPVSNLFRDLNKLIRYIGIFMVPMAGILFVNNYFQLDKNVGMTVNKTAGAIIGMIPAGIYLLVTLTLSLSVIKLGKRRTLVQDMYSIEMLASADVVCLDKTGTVTDGTMEVTQVLPLGGAKEEDVFRAVALIEGAEESLNQTSLALVARFGKENAQTVGKIPFSSARKYSAVSFAGIGTFAIGAPHFLPCPVSDETEKLIAAHAERGERVLLVARLPDLESPGEAIGLVAVSDRIRPNAAETIARFQSQGVAVKIISGDHAATVSSIAKKVGVRDAEKYLSCEGLSDEELAAKANDYAVFGRVTPEQKILLVRTFRAAGHTVAMTGDGVNDTLALKESDCSIAMADGSEMARKVAKIVLLDSDFGALPDVVREGRKCINNVRMSGALFLMKTLFTIALSIFVVALQVPYPYEPVQFVPLELIVIGMASLLLALEPNEKRIEGSFISTVLKSSAPKACAMLLPIFVLLIGAKVTGMFPDSAAVVSAVSTCAVTLAAYINLLFLCSPYTKWRFGVVGLATAALAVVFSVCYFLLGDMMILSPGFGRTSLLLGCLGIAVSVSVLVNVGKMLIAKK